jgi:hypothetical protein
VNYDTRNWRLLAAHLLDSAPQDALSAVTRAQLLDDALNLARAGSLAYGVALDMTRYLATKESHYVPWTAMFENLRFLNLMLRQTPAYGVFQVLEAVMYVQRRALYSGFVMETLSPRNGQVLCSKLRQERTIPTERPLPTFVERGCHVVSVTDSYGRIVGFLDPNRYFFFQVAPQLYPRG